MDGFLLVDKPPVSTSFNVVSLCRKVFQMTKVGHSGTLDPFATGLLMVALGEGLKLLEYLPAQPKEYVGTAVLGATSTTYDCDGVISVTIPPDGSLESLREKIDLLLINTVIQENFLGSISQVPPDHSAVKVRGIPAYIRARRGEELLIAPRQVQIDLFEVTKFEYPFLSFRVQVSSGTYIRSLLHDLGILLGTGAYLDSLRRTRIAQFSVEDAVSVPQLEGSIGKGGEVGVLPLEQVVQHMPRRDLTEAEYLPLSNGLFVDALPADHAALQTSHRVLAAFLGNRLVGVLEFATPNKLKFRKKLHVDLTV